jgi:hypothetical protein
VLGHLPVEPLRLGLEVRDALVLPRLAVVAQEDAPGAGGYPALLLFLKLFKTRCGGLLVRRPVLVLPAADADRVSPAARLAILPDAALAAGAGGAAGASLRIRGAVHLSPPCSIQSMRA